MAAVRLQGRSAAPGFAMGPVHHLAHAPVNGVVYRPSGDRNEEAARLRAAIADAREDIEKLAGKTGGTAADVLMFQVAMLSDEALAEAAFQDIADGVPADKAWDRALDAELSHYLSAEDELFRARASDLKDIKHRVADVLAGGRPHLVIPHGAIVLADDLPPSQFLETDWADGAVLLRAGSPTSHVAILARARGVPMIVGLAGSLAPGQQVAVDAATGLVIVDPSRDEQADFEARRRAVAQDESEARRREREPAITADGIAIGVLINIADPRELDGLDPGICDGVGLARTELMFEGNRLPDEERQYRAYRRIAEWAEGRPVTIRTLDAGGDKPIPGLTPEGESNPFLGVRGIRLTLARPDVFRPQLRALARAAVHGTVEIMIPMVSVPREFEAARNLLDDVVGELARQNVPHRRPPLGMMVEVPAAAISIDQFDADFYSIGSNDLVQYVLAAGRDIAAVSDLARADEDAVLRLIARVADHGARTGRKVSLCGDAGGDPELIPALLICGLRTLSMSPRRLAHAKAAIRAARADGAVA